jgi:hypothetical protein
MTQYHVLYRAGSHHCYSTEDGIHRTEVGCSHRLPESAIDHSDVLASRSAQAEHDSRRAGDLGLMSEAPEQSSVVRRWKAAPGAPARATPLRAGAPATT